MEIQHGYKSKSAIVHTQQYLPLLKLGNTHVSMIEHGTAPVPKKAYQLRAQKSDIKNCYGCDTYDLYTS